VLVATGLGFSSSYALLCEHLASVLEYLYKVMMPTKQERKTFNEDKPKWKQHPTAKHLFSYIVHSVKVSYSLLLSKQFKYPNFNPQSNILQGCLQICLSLINDFETPNKIIGVKCLQHIMQNANPTEIRWFGTPILEVLQASLVFKEIPFISLLLPCLFKALSLLEPNTKADVYHKVFKDLMKDMDRAIMMNERQLATVCILSKLCKCLAYLPR
jgi:hypothetical protein